MAIASDLLHHLFESLMCLEKRKVIVALNLLRKPLKDNLVYLAWMLGDEDDFYDEFTTGNPERLAPKRIGNRRVTIFSKAIARTRLDSIVDASLLNEVLFDRRSARGLEELFQHAVHLITVQNMELRTSPENFNFIFKNNSDDDIYEIVYHWLPYILLFLAHVIAGLFDRMRRMDDGSKRAFYIRTLCGFFLIVNLSDPLVRNLLRQTLMQHVSCKKCGAKLSITRYNGVRIVLTESFRCTVCRRVNAFPFSWLA
jgi:hypothetical protein